MAQAMGNSPSAVGDRQGGAAPRIAILFDRDGTLVEDVPYNGDPDRVRIVPDAFSVLELLRRRGIPFGVVSNQSGVGRRLITMEAVLAVNRVIEQALGPIPVWAICPHAPEDQCRCRKPSPGLILEAASALGVEPGQCVVIGDSAKDTQAAARAGARGILISSPVGLWRHQAPMDLRAAVLQAIRLGGQP